MSNLAVIVAASIIIPTIAVLVVLGVGTAIVDHMTARIDRDAEALRAGVAWLDRFDPEIEDDGEGDEPGTGWDRDDIADHEHDRWTDERLGGAA